ncbi:MAG TPA: rhodanese-like domain-containing protein [Phnomibacter sp.]|nr:rhodanese-like domain-containing protein [Phnomibacter sp.]
MKHITVEELKSRLDAGEAVHLVDVREDDERAEFNIGGLHHKLGLVQAMQFDDLEDLKGEEVIVYCRSGNRSQVAAHIMEAAGFTNIVNLSGGMLDWNAKFGK